MIGIMGAMDAEITEFLSHAEGIERTEWRGFEFHKVRLDGREAVLVKSGIGKVFSALVSQHLIDTYAPSSLIFTGVAGALNPAYEIGDVVISRDCMMGNPRFPLVLRPITYSFPNNLRRPRLNTV